MKFSKLYCKPRRDTPQYESINATLLIKAGFIFQTLSGSYSILPLGLRVLNKIEKIIREEMDQVATELYLTNLGPQENWKQTGRLETIDVLMKTTPANQVSAAKNSSEYILNPTHEDILTPIVQQFATSYRDLPVALYQIQTKFRNEPRAKSGLLRGREFRMKDLYSFHTSEGELLEYYEMMKGVYTHTFERLGLSEGTFISLASGGDFTKNYSHEFQTKLESGEDLIFYSEADGIYYNKEVVPTQKPDDPLEPGLIDPKTGKEYQYFKASEVGNIFPLNTKFSQAFNYTYTDQNGKQQYVYMGSYGIGTTRVMGVMVEKFADDKGMVWPKNVAPYHIHLISLPGGEEFAAKLYSDLLKNNIEVLWDDRAVSAGVKFSDADLIGLPVRLVASHKTKNQVEWKLRTSDQVELIDVSEIEKKLAAL